MSKKITYRINNLECANCAAKVERFLNNQEEVDHAVISFANSSLQIYYKKSELEPQELEKRIAKINTDGITVEVMDIKKMSTKQSIWTKESIVLLIRILVSFAVAMAGFIVFGFLNNWTFHHNAFWQLGGLDNNQLTMFWSEFAVMLVAFIIITYDIAWKVFKSFAKPSSILSENFLMFIAAVGAIATGNFFEGALVIILAQVGQLFEHVSVTKSRNSVIDAINLRPSNANLITDSGIRTIEPNELNVGDSIEIRVGETVPVDGVVIRGDGALNTMSLTGESQPVHVTKNSVAMSGTTLVSGSLVLKVTHTFENSKIAKLIELVMNSGNKKGKMETFLQKFARWYTPVIISLAFLVFAIYPFVVGGATGWDDNWSTSLYIALTFLTVGCPCAILVAVPIAYFSGSGLASKNKVIIKGSNYLEGLLNVSEVITDKTGTLTKGLFTVVEKRILVGTENDFLNYLLALEVKSNHPLAQSLRSIFKDHVSEFVVSDFKEVAGYGLEGMINSQLIFVGGQKFLKKEGIEYPKPNEYGSEVYLVVNGVVHGYVVLGDTLKDDSITFVRTLQDAGVKVTMLTGDNEGNAEAIGKRLGIQNIVANLLPEDKVNYVDEAKKLNRNSTIYIGDGINDAPCIISSDVGVAMGGIGSDVSVDNADIVIMNDQPTKLLDAQKIAKATRFRAVTNIIVALTIKITLMILALFNLMPMWVAVLADTGLTILCVIWGATLISKRIKPTYQKKLVCADSAKCTTDKNYGQ